MANFLLIGGNGFIGSHILDVLLKNNHSVKVFDKNSEKYRPPIENIEYFLSDFNDKLALSEALTDVDCVIHALSTSIPSTSNKFPIQDIEGNLINTLNLLEIMVEKRINNIVFLSSGGTVYGVPEFLPVSELHQTNPICSYGIVKLSIEKYLHLYSNMYEINPTILRISNPFGPRQSHLGNQGFISTLLNNHLKGQYTKIFGDGSVIRDYIYISDVANVCYNATLSNKSGIFNVGSNSGYSLNDIIRISEDIIGEKILVKYIEKRSFDIPEIVLDTSKINLALNWQPTISIQDGILLYLNWLKENYYE